MSEKRLMRSRSDSIFLGVAGGLANYFDIDPVLVRLVFVIIVLASFGKGLLVYLLLAILMPQEGQPTAKAQPFSEEEIVIEEGT